MFGFCMEENCLVFEWMPFNLHKFLNSIGNNSIFSIGNNSVFSSGNISVLLEVYSSFARDICNGMILLHVKISYFFVNFLVRKYPSRRITNRKYYGLSSNGSISIKINNI